MSHKHIGIKLQLPKPAQPVERRELTITNKGESKTYLLPGSATMSDEMVFTDEDSFKATLVDIDAHGNRSLPSDSLSVNVKEDMRPAKPEPMIVEKENWRILTDKDVERIRKESARKANEAAKAEAAKAQQIAEDAEAVAQQHAKLDADAEEAKAAMSTKKHHGHHAPSSPPK